MDIILGIIAGVSLLINVVILVLLKGRRREERELRLEQERAIQDSMRNMGGLMTDHMSAQLSQVEQRLRSFESGNEQKLEQIRGMMQGQLVTMQLENEKRLDEMRQMVDERLQESLEIRMTRSFELVSQRLEQVYRGLGEMQSLAEGVGDLKRVLSNVKTRGILGELQLGAILEELLAPEQYDRDVRTRPDSRAVVEFAIRMPSEQGDITYLPVDSKFPVDAYEQLLSAYDEGGKEGVVAAQLQLRNRLRGFAKDIHDKYVEPPFTTEFAILFLPIEGLYAEAVKMGMVEDLQRQFRVSIAGPSTMAAILNSLQMGFRSVAIQKRSSEVWNVLGSVKAEFDKFGDILESTQQRLTQAGQELDKLVGVRTRAIQRKLRDVESIETSGKENL